MRPRIAVLPLVAVLILLGLGTAPTHAGDFFTQTRFGSDFFSASPPCPVRDIPTFETIAPVPSIFDTNLNSTAFFQCFVQVERNEKPVKKAKGTFETELIIRHNDTGMLEVFPIMSGKFKTDSDGRDEFDFDIPTELFADGFESGDVSAWAYTRSDFTSKKKADNAWVQCGKGASRQNN